MKKFIDATADITPAKLSILENLPDVVKNGTYAGSGEYRVKTIEGKCVSVPYERFETPVTASGERYLVKFNVADAPGGAGGAGRAVRAIEIEKAVDASTEVLIVTQPKLEQSTVQGYNGSNGSKEHFYCGNVIIKKPCTSLLQFFNFIPYERRKCAVFANRVGYPAFYAKVLIFLTYYTIIWKHHLGTIKYGKLTERL